MINKLTDTITYIGVYDKTLDLFEDQYPVPNGITYNSYLIRDQKIAVMDTVDSRMSNDWFRNLEAALKGAIPDYLIIHHMEPDHSSCISTFLEKFPNVKIIGNNKTFGMISQFFDINIDNNKYQVIEGDILDLGNHKLTFYMAPMVHWPEVMVSYDSVEKILFSADAFGTFGSIDNQEKWDEEAGRYYFNIVGKYGFQVQSLLKKINKLNIEKIAPLHGPLLDTDIKQKIEKYSIWSSYEPEKKGLLIAYASIYGHTYLAAKKLSEMFESRGVENIILFDLAREDHSYALDYAFRFDTLILASATYEGGLFPPMESFISCLKSKNFQNRKVGILENGSWAPAVLRILIPTLSAMKNIRLCDKSISIKSAMKETDKAIIDEFVDSMINLK